MKSGLTAVEMKTRVIIPNKNLGDIVTNGELEDGSEWVVIGVKLGELGIDITCIKSGNNRWSYYGRKTHEFWAYCRLIRTAEEERRLRGVIKKAISPVSGLSI